MLKKNWKGKIVMLPELNSIIRPLLNLMRNNVTNIWKLGRRSFHYVRRPEKGRSSHLDQKNVISDLSASI